MSRLIQTLRSNAIAVLALVLAILALAGASYAAINIPAGSVGTRALRNGAVTANKLGKGSVTAAKLNSKSIAGTIVFWARIASTGQVLASSKPAKTQGWGGLGGNVVFHGALSKNCFALASATQNGSVSDVNSNSTSGQTEIGMRFADNELPPPPSPIAVDVAEICP